MYRFNPTVHIAKWEEMCELAQKFIDLETDKPQIFYIWGHSYELVTEEDWSEFEKFCAFVANREDVCYCTNLEILEG